LKIIHLFGPWEKANQQSNPHEAALLPPQMGHLEQNSVNLI